ncbi:MAG: phosphoglucosamine mutase, partial [Salinarchaeum sp.]
MDIFGSSGVRGVVNDEMTPTFALQVAQAAGTVWSASRVAVARDTRTSGRMLT